MSVRMQTISAYATLWKYSSEQEREKIQREFDRMTQTTLFYDAGRRVMRRRLKAGGRVIDTGTVAFRISKEVRDEILRA